RFLATWLASRNIAPDAATVGSKWGYTYTAGWKTDADKHEVKEHTLPVLHRQFAESRQLLGAHLDLYQIHSGTLASAVLENAGGGGKWGGGGGGGGAGGRRPEHRPDGDGAAPGRDDPPRPRRGGRRRAAVRVRAGNLEPSGAVGRPGVAGGARRGPRRHRQGRAGERPANLAQHPRGGRGEAAPAGGDPGAAALHD